MSPAPTEPSPARTTITHLLTSFNALSPTAIISLRTPSCTRAFLPSSLGLPPQTNDQYLANLTEMKGVFRNFEVQVQECIEGRDEDGGERIVLLVKARGDTMVGEYRNEYVWFVGFEDEVQEAGWAGGEGVEAGKEGGKWKRISSWTEYVDAGMVRDFYPRLRGAVLEARKKQS